MPLKKYLFAVYPKYIDEGFLLAQYSLDNLGKKIAVFYQNDDYGKEGLRGVQKYMHDNNLGRAGHGFGRSPGTPTSPPTPSS